MNIHIMNAVVSLATTLQQTA